MLLMVLPAVLYFLIFNYLPMPGIILAFKRFNYAQGIFASPWAGLENFRFFFGSGDAWFLTRNTILYNVAFCSWAQPCRCWWPSCCRRCG